MMSLLNRLEDEIVPYIVQIGVGGTGSSVAQQVAQMLSIHGKGAYVLVDPDIVEEKNLNNQLFTSANIGFPKAEILAKRYSAAYHIPCYSFTERYVEDVQTIDRIFSESLSTFRTYGSRLLPIIIGTVDNNFTRKVIHDFFNHSHVSSLLYIDAGNESVDVPHDVGQRPIEEWNDEELKCYNESGWTGQVVCGLKLQSSVLLEPVANLYPDILTSDDDIAPSTLSCEELSASDPQRLITNRFAAMIVSSYIAEVLNNSTISKHHTVFHAQRGYMKSKTI